MIASLVSRLAQLLSENGNLSNAENTSEFVAFVKSDLFKDKLNLFERDTYAPQATTGYFDGHFVTRLFDHQGWNAALIRHDEIAKGGSQIVSSPCKSLIGPVQSSGVTTLEIFNHATELQDDPAKGPGTHAEFVRRTDLTEGTFWASSSREQAFNISAMPSGSIFLRIDSPIESHYSHAFDVVTRRYLFSGLPGDDSICREILSYIIKASTDANYISAEGPDRAMTLKLLDSLLEDTRTAPVSKWRLVQALYVFEPEKAVKRLKDWAKGDGALSNVARATLQGTQ